MRPFQSSPAAKQRLEVESLLLSSQEEAVEGKREKNEWAKRNKSQSGWGELVYSAISIKEIGLH